MTAKLRCLAMAVSASLLTTIRPSLAQTWTQTSAPLTNWTAVACSADGSKLVAGVGYFIGVSPVPPGSICVSQDAGSTWAATSAPNTNWVSVASSADGTKLVAAANGFYCTGGFGPYEGLIYTSSDSGTTWHVSSAPNTNWCSVASSADGTKLVAAVGGAVFGFNCGGPPGPIYVSTNTGATWTITSAPIAGWNSVAASADGTTLVAAGYGQVYTSTNSGATWEVASMAGGYLGSVACSADGTRLVAGTHNLGNPDSSPVYVSTDFGATWTVSDLKNAGRDSVACSADGTKLVGVAAGSGRTGPGQVLTSTNYGASWTLNNTPSGLWSSVASSADGGRLVAAVNGGGIWTAQFTVAPLLHITPSGSNLVLSWTAPSLPFVLQENSDLTTTNWTNVPGTPELNFTNLQNQLTLPLPTANRFYRLKY